MANHDHTTKSTILRQAAARLRRKRNALRANSCGASPQNLRSLQHVIAGAAMLALTAVAVPAAAQQLSVYDSTGKLVGPLVGEDTVIVTLGGFKQYLTIGQNSYATNAELYFPDPNCRATIPLVAYDSWSELFPHAVYDGTTLYYLDPRQDAGYAVQSKIENGQCVHLPDNQTLVSTSAHPIASPWTPPFSVR